jgi:hypothetical protein
MVVDAIKGSFNLLINASPNRLSSFEPNISLEGLHNENEDLGIKEDAQQMANDLHEVLMEDLTNIDENLKGIDDGEVDINAVNEVLQAQFSANIEKVGEEEEDRNEEPDDEVLQDVYDRLRVVLQEEKSLNDDYLVDAHGNIVDKLEDAIEERDSDFADTEEPVFRPDN